MTRILLPIIFSILLTPAFGQKIEKRKKKKEKERQEEYDKFYQQINGDGPPDWNKPEYNYMINLADRNSIFSFDNRYQGVYGTPYWTLDWCKGAIELNGGNWISNVKMKYDAYFDQLLVDINGNTRALSNEMIQSFVIEVKDKTYHMQKKEVEWVVGIFPHDFSKILFSGERYHLLFQPHKKFKKASFKGPYNMGQAYDEFTDIGYYLFSRDEKYYTRLKLSKRSLLKTFPNKKDKIRRIIRDNKINVHSEAGIIKVLELLDS